MKKHHMKLTLFFVLPVFVMALICLFYPDHDVSKQENRTLAKFPEFSMQRLWSGEFARDFETYFSDQFPFRSAFVSLDKAYESAMTVKGGEGATLVAKTGDSDLGSGESLLEREGKTPAPDPNMVTVQVPKPTAAPVTVDEANVQNKGSILIVGDRAVEIFGSYPGIGDEYVSIINTMKEKMPNANVYSMVVPTSVEFYSPEQYHSLSSSQKDAIASMYDAMSPDVKKVDAYSYIAANADKYIYFRTDHHWTARGAYYGYMGFCREAGLAPVPIDKFSVQTVEGFVGTMYGYTQSQVLKDNPDTVEILSPPAVESCKSYTTTVMDDGVDSHVIYTKLEGTSNKYLAFLGGDHPLLHIVTGNKNGKKIALVKDSFGNAFAPFLINHYEEIYVIDPRKIDMYLPYFVTQHEIDDVLIENYAFAVSNKTIKDGMKKLVGM